MGDAVAMFQFSVFSLGSAVHITPFSLPSQSPPSNPPPLLDMQCIPKTKRAWICDICPAGVGGFNPGKGKRERKRDIAISSALQVNLYFFSLSLLSSPISSVLLSPPPQNTERRTASGLRADNCSGGIWCRVIGPTQHSP